MSSSVGGQTRSVPSADTRVDDLAEIESAYPGSTNVLIICGEPAERSILHSILAPLGHCLLVASSADHGREFVSRRDFAVIVLDERSVDVDGFETAALIRAQEPAAHTPIIFLTMRSQDDDELESGYGMGAVDFIVAPVAPAALRAKVSLFADLFAKEQELAERAEQLRAAATSSAEALAFQLEILDRMEQLGRAKSDFVSKISHELRSPLTSVIGYVELLLDGGPGEPSPEQGRMLEIVDRNSRRLLALIEDLLTMLRVEAGTFELEVGPVDLREVIERVTETTAPTIVTAQLHLAVDLDSVLELVGDRDQLERALLNLVSNSVKFTAPGGQIEIATRSDGDEIALCVRDTGAGIPADEQEQLFTRLFRSTRAQEQHVDGAGLGLYIVKQIIELHGGSIDVLSTPDGSTFTMRVPISGPPADPLALVRRS